MPDSERSPSPCSPLQQRIKERIEAMHIPVGLLKAVPGLGDQLHEFLTGDPRAAHTLVLGVWSLLGIWLAEDQEYGTDSSGPTEPLVSPDPSS